jgi:hypothetical protein
MIFPNLLDTKSLQIAILGAHRHIEDYGIVIMGFYAPGAA